MDQTDGEMDQTDRGPGETDQTDRGPGETDQAGRGPGETDQTDQTGRGPGETEDLTGGHAGRLLRQLNLQRSRGLLCDVVVAAGDALFRAHKSVLAASGSGLLGALVLHDNLVRLDAEMVSAAVFRQVLDFIYTGRLPLRGLGFSALLKAASYLQLSDLAALCRERLKSSSSSRRTVPSPSPAPQRHFLDRPSVSGKAGRSQKWEGRPKEEESSFISQRVSLGPSGVVGAGRGLGLDLSRKSPTGGAVMEEEEEEEPSGLQQASLLAHSGSTNNGVLSDDMTAGSASTLRAPGGGGGGGRSGRRSDTTAAEVRKRPRTGSALETGFAVRGKRWGPVGGATTRTTRREDVGDGDGEEAAAAAMENGSGRGGEGRDVDKVQNANYVYRRSAAGGLGAGLGPAPGGEDLYVCVPCGRGFPSEEELSAHVDAHDAGEEEELGSDFLAEEEEDGVVDRGAGNLPPQKTLVKEEEPDPEWACPVSPYVCAVCGEFRVDRASLRDHEKSHRPFPCAVCGKRFTQRGTMKRHARSHLGLKPFACAECGMRFTRQYRLTEHGRVHSGEKPYGCQLCGGRFTHQRYLVAHLKMHTTSPP